jgi:hypothetical protein
MTQTIILLCLNTFNQFAVIDYGDGPVVFLIDRNDFHLGRQTPNDLGQAFE